ncbi:MAG TPA: AMP-binding protein [Bacillota bacterium]
MDVVYVPHPLGTQVPVYRRAASSPWLLFRERAQAHPERPAVGDDVKDWSYGELYRAAVGMAAYFQQRLEVSAGERVALYMRNRVEYAAALLACLALGAVAVPLNTRLAPRELAVLLADCEPCCIVTDEDRAVDPPSGAAGRCTVIDATELLHAATNAANEAVEAMVGRREPGPWDPALILYTSGTTGTPKGAVVGHGNLAQNVLNFRHFFGTGPDTRTLMPVPFYHVTGLLALFLHTVAVGGFVRLMADFQTQTFLDRLEADAITYTCVVPAIYTLAVQHPSFARRDLRHWQVAAYGGSPMPVEVIRKLTAALPAIRAMNTYGATEVTGSCTFLPAEQAAVRPDSVGRPTPIHRLRIVDEQGRDLPVGEVGEVAITGGTLTLGYWRNPEATQREFRDGWWLSGDLGRLDADGYLYVLGRKRDTINRGGEKIYPLEVEEVLYNHPDVLEAAVVGVPHPVFGQEVAAAIVPRPDRRVEPEALRAFLAGQLADYKVPRRLLLVAALPKNPAGKVVKAEVARLFEEGAVDSPKLA